jgi:hypothetical protein
MKNTLNKTKNLFDKFKQKQDEDKNVIFEQNLLIE